MTTTRDGIKPELKKGIGKWWLVKSGLRPVLVLPKGFCIFRGLKKKEEYSTEIIYGLQNLIFSIWPLLLTLGKNVAIMGL